MLANLILKFLSSRKKSDTIVLIKKPGTRRRSRRTAQSGVGTCATHEREIELVDKNDGKIKCKRCNGKGEYRVRITYKGKTYYYFSKCAECYARGYLDWVEYARGRLPGIRGIFFDNNPAGSVIIATENLGGCSVYDGHNYISIKTPRGKALWDTLVSKENEKGK